MSRMVAAVVLAVFGVSATIIGFTAMAGPFSELMDAFDTQVSDVNNTSLDNFWNFASPTLKKGYWFVGGIAVLAYIVWVFLYAQRREYVTAGGVAYR